MSRDLCFLGLMLVQMAFSLASVFKSDNFRQYRYTYMYVYFSVKCATFYPVVIKIEKDFEIILFTTP